MRARPRGAGPWGGAPHLPGRNKTAAGECVGRGDGANSNFGSLERPIADRQKGQLRMDERPTADRQNATADRRKGPLRIVKKVNCGSPKSELRIETRTADRCRINFGSISDQNLNRELTADQLRINRGSIPDQNAQRGARGPPIEACRRKSEPLIKFGSTAGQKPEPRIKT